MLDLAKIWMSLICWLFCLPLLLIRGSMSSQFHTVALILFFIFVGLLCLRLKKQSAVIVGVLLVIGYIITEGLPTWQDLKDSSEFVLIFACLIPTIALVRATAMTMSCVIDTQNKLASLAPYSSSAGIQLTSHVLGGFINVGTFALVAVALPRGASLERRQTATLATLRGMNSAILWSPFFLSFAVASFYLPEGFATGAISLGLVNAVIFYLITQAITSPKHDRISVSQSISPLNPIAARLFLIILAVVFTSTVTGLTALSAVCATMPALCAFQFLRKPYKIKQIWRNFSTLQRNSGDEVVIISVSMLIASLLGQTDQFAIILASFFGLNPDIKLVLFSIPVLVWAGSVIGIHPIISSAPLLAFFAPNLTVYDAAFVAQAHMIGWSTGTMISFASLSTIIAAENFRINPAQISFGKNFFIAAGLAIGGGLILIFVHELVINIFGP